jgi:hypothetical protein
MTQSVLSIAVQIPITGAQRRRRKSPGGCAGPLLSRENLVRAWPPLKEALVIPGHLPWLKWYFDAV